MNQASFSSNWKAGGVNSFGFNGLMNYKANYKKDKNTSGTTSSTSFTGWLIMKGKVIVKPLIGFI
ncbi:MAG: DUF3078 domain-containing protein [Cytophagales bacterium]|nr:DUF3078 domain-containing protein [Cytophagales bacterium]